MILNRLFFCSFFLLFSLSITFAKVETGRKYFQAGQLKKGGSITLRDDAIFGSGGNFKSNWSQNFGIKQTSNSIELSINKNALNANTANFSATFHMNLYYKDKNNQVVPNWKGNDTTKVNLTIHYNKSADYRNKDTYAFAGGVFVYVQNSRP